MRDFMSERTSPLSKTPLLLLCALIACALWGSAIPFIKLSYARFRIDTGNPGSLLLFAGVRFMLAAPRFRRRGTGPASPLSAFSRPHCSISATTSPCAIPPV